MEIEARVAEIQKLKIAEIKTLAENLGYSKPDSVTWKDAASAIAKLEAEDAIAKLEEGFNGNVGAEERLAAQWQALLAAAGVEESALDADVIVAK